MGNKQSSGAKPNFIHEEAQAYNHVLDNDGERLYDPIITDNLPTVKQCLGCHSNYRFNIAAVCWQCQLQGVWSLDEPLPIKDAQKCFAAAEKEVAKDTKDEDTIVNEYTALLQLIPSLSPSEWEKQRDMLIAKGVTLVRAWYQKRHQLSIRGDLPKVFKFKLLERAVLHAQLAAYVPLSPSLFTFSTDILSKEAKAMLQLEGKELRAKLRQECPATFSMMMFSDAFNQALLKEVRNIQALYPTAPLNYKGLELEQLGVTPFMEEFTKMLNKWLHTLLPNIMLQYSHSSIIHYDSVKSKHLGQPPHRDDSDLTMNMCFGTPFTGSELLLTIPGTKTSSSNFHSKPAQQVSLPAKESKGYSMYPAEPEINDVTAELEQKWPTYQYNQEPGRALFHPGKVVHSALDIQSGQRWNLVVWWNAFGKFHHFSELTAEIQLLVASFLTVKDVGALAQTCVAMSRVCRSEWLWETLYNETFPPLAPEVIEEDSKPEFLPMPFFVPKKQRAAVPSPDQKKVSTKKEAKPEIIEHKTEVPDADFEPKIKEPKTPATFPRPKPTRYYYNHQQRVPKPYISYAGETESSYRAQFYALLQERLGDQEWYNYEASREHPPMKMIMRHNPARPMPSSYSFKPMLHQLNAKSADNRCFLQ